MQSEAKRRLNDALFRTGRQDARAFRLVYRLTAAKLFGICLRICNDRRAAEDVLQDVYLSVWTRAAGFDPARGSAIAWLATIARNRSIDWRRTHRPAGASDEMIAALPDPSPSAPDAMLRDEHDRRLHFCLDTLEGRQRDAIRTAFFDGLTYAELAERAAVPLGTMKSWVRRGLMRLRECLNGADA
ncbi:sigma-70 family RNA polymerase sigma factor [Sphingomonas sp. NBWT7]|uniref:sigma-70 family RNA polymerase sigma factor n=1 Tax=Sphingomonas sp. NBWT7 TaxID=2596913 RepID=UPI0021561DB1|nr:sigma-70 family RNA polymerase sigma factor [Sphingomonas sp. NBWT7]